MTNGTLTSLLYLLGFGFLFYWMMKKGGCGMHAHGHQHGGGRHADHDVGRGSADHAARTARDPVCGMDVDPARAAGTRLVAGEAFYLCSTTCLAKFDSDPEGYARRVSPAVASSGKEGHHHHGH